MSRLSWTCSFPALEVFAGGHTVPCWVLLAHCSIPSLYTAWALAQLQDGGEMALLRGALAQAEQEGLGQGEDVHVVAQINPRDIGKLAGVLKGVGEVTQQRSGQPVAVEGQRGEAGQRAECRQQLEDHVICEAREAQLHAVHLLPTALQVAAHPLQVTRGQWDARQVYRVVQRASSQDSLEAEGEKGRAGFR